MFSLLLIQHVLSVTVVQTNGKIRLCSLNLGVDFPKSRAVDVQYCRDRQHGDTDKSQKRGSPESL